MSVLLRQKGAVCWHLSKRIAKEVQAALYKYMGKGGVLMDEVREQVQVQEQEWLHWNDSVQIAGECQVRLNSVS